MTELEKHLMSTLDALAEDFQAQGEHFRTETTKLRQEIRTLTDQVAILGQNYAKVAKILADEYDL